MQPGNKSSEGKVTMPAKKPKTIFYLLLLSLLLWHTPTAWSQVNIKGEIVDDAGNPVDSAIVSLINGKISVTSNANGGFTLSGDVNEIRTLVGPAMRTQILEYEVAGGSVQVTAELFNVAGRRISWSSVKRSAGYYKLDISRLIKSTASQMYILKLNIGSERYVFKFVCLQGEIIGCTREVSRGVQFSAEGGLSHSKTATQMDTLVITKQGLVLRRIAIVFIGGDAGKIVIQRPRFNIKIDPTRFVDKGDVYVYEGDIIIPKTTVQWADLGKATQARYSVVLTPNAASRITVFIDESLLSWANIIQMAMEEWNNNGSSVHFVRQVGGNYKGDSIGYDNNGTAYTIKPNISIYGDQSPNLPSSGLDNLPPTTLGCAAVPYCNSLPGFLISINMDAPLLATDEYRLSVILHEIGHTLGLEHVGCPIGEWSSFITGTPEVDQTSIMLWNVSGYTTLSYWDKVAAQILWPVQPFPVITSSLSATGRVGDSFNYTVSAVNNPSSFTATGLPVGLSLNVSTGMISGTPVSAGISTVSLSAINSTGVSYATLRIKIDGIVPVIKSPLIAVGKIGVPFNYAILATNIPTSYSATDLPADLTLNTSTGVISGTPTSMGVSYVTLGAINIYGLGSATLRLTVNPVEEAPFAFCAVSAKIGNEYAKHVFGTSADNAVWAGRDETLVPWSGFSSLGGNAICAPAAVSKSSGCVDVFATGTDKAVWTRSWNGSSWSDWKNLAGTVISTPAAVSKSAGSMDIFATGIDGAVWTRSWNGSSWSGWVSLGGNVASAPVAISKSAGCVDVFVTGTDKAIWTRSWNGSSWSDWVNLGGNWTSQPAVASKKTGDIDIFATGVDNAV